MSTQGCLGVYFDPTQLLPTSLPQVQPSFIL